MNASQQTQLFQQLIVEFGQLQERMNKVLMVIDEDNRRRNLSASHPRTEAPAPQTRLNPEIKDRTVSALTSLRDNITRVAGTNPAVLKPASVLADFGPKTGTITPTPVSDAIQREGYPEEKPTDFSFEQHGDNQVTWLEEEPEVLEQPIQAIRIPEGIWRQLLSPEVIHGGRGTIAPAFKGLKIYAADVYKIMANSHAQMLTAPTGFYRATPQSDFVFVFNGQYGLIMTELKGKVNKPAIYISHNKKDVAVIEQEREYEFVGDSQLGAIYKELLNFGSRP